MAHPACPKQNSTAADLAILECSLLRTGSICSIGYGLACKLFMALARGLMLNGSSGRLTESDSPQMYTYMCRHTLRRVHRKPLLMTPPSEMLSFQKSCFPGDCAHSKAVGMPSVTEKAHLQCHLGEGRLLDLCAGLQPSRCCQNSEHSTIFLQESYSEQGFLQPLLRCLAYASYLISHYPASCYFNFLNGPKLLIAWLNAASER